MCTVHSLPPDSWSRGPRVAGPSDPSVAGRDSGRRRDRGGRRAGGARGHRGAGRRRQEGDPARPGAGGQPRRPGVLVARRADVRGQPRAAPHAGQGLLRAGAPGLDGHRGLRPPRGRVAAQVGRGVRGLLRRREALVAARPGHALDPQPGLARARRLPRRRPRQLRAALPHHLGHRPRRGGAVRAAGARGGGARARGAALPPPGRRADGQRRRRDRRGRQAARARARPRAASRAAAPRSATSS